MRRDFLCGLVSRREKEKGGWQYRRGRERVTEEERDSEILRIHIIVTELMATNMAIDVMDGVRDKKEVVKHVKAYIPKNQWPSAHRLIPSVDKFMANHLLGPKCETFMEKVLKVHQPTQSSLPLKEEYIRKTERFFPLYFSESFAAQQEEAAERREVTLTLHPPEEDKQVSLTMAKKTEDGSTVSEPLCSISEICNIALQQVGGLQWKL